ncbi:MAG TPA: helix-turn-helix domain-containing protein [Acidimicrobiales bacterium]
MQREGQLRDRILEAAERLTMRHGFAATTVDAVLRAAGASKGAFFHHFPTKADLGRALVERYAAADLALLDAKLTEAEAASDDPAEQLLFLIRSFETAADDAMDAQPTCLFISFIYERDLVDDTTSKVLADAVLHWRRRILDKLEAAAAKHPQLRSVDLEALADHWFATFEGAFLLAGATGDRGVMRRQLSVLRNHLELLLGHAPTTSRQRRVGARVKNS